ncbi:hypothetical protein MASSI9I_10095 [Massilia sp. 9I]|nr:hypothetical protein MASSI9I_10095 [Massilia sp. 9I]
MPNAARAAKRVPWARELRQYTAAAPNYYICHELVIFGQ